MKENLLDAKLINLNIQASDNVDAINQLGKMLVDNGYIDPSYTKSIIEREQTFPTGLVLASAGIAIPHASPENNVLKNGIAAISLVKPVKFHSMENPDSEIDVDMVFMLALASSTDHLDVLKKLFVAFQNQSLVNALKHSTDKAEFLKLLTNNLI